ncbi:hypothetical protein CKS97_19820 [Salmonella enterica subsp. enterica serovar Java]|nr:hypothetical protein [Salmonella enterica subsp. enterica serovar Java]
MIDYAALSDEEVNRLVAEKLKMVIDGHYYNSNAVPAGVTGNGDIKPFDPCNNVSDTWPIIVDHKIDIQFRTPMPNPVPMAKNGDLYSIDKNPLRAAMIVFLQMQENKQ